MRSKKFRDPDYLDHIADRIARIERATSSMDFPGYLQNQDLQAAIERYIEIIGEAAGNLSQQTRDLAPDVPWAQIIGARNVIIHGYAEVEPDRIWDIVKNHIPALHVAVERLRARVKQEAQTEHSQQAQSNEGQDHSKDLGR